MSRATSPVVAVALLSLVTIGLAGGFVVTATDALPTPDPAAHVSFDVEATQTGLVVLEHRGGPALNATEIRLRVEIDGQPFDNQPPVPFFAAAGFHGGPTGPFNQASDPAWTVGETASFRVASTNEPDLLAGRTLSVVVFADGQRVGTAETTIAG